MWRQLSIRAGLTFAVLFLAACQPKIGDACLVDKDCSQLGDRVCDSSQPGGYCSQFNCDPSSCPPGESICVGFSTALSSVDGCDDPNRQAPFARTFCMRVCERDKDCREGYVCIDVAEANPWSAEVIQKNPTSTMICAVPATAALPEHDLLSGLPENVCVGTQMPGGQGGAPSGYGGAAGSTEP